MAVADNNSTTTDSRKMTRERGLRRIMMVMVVEQKVLLAALGRMAALFAARNVTLRRVNAQITRINDRAILINSRNSNND